jgi:flagellar motor switch protein FliG
MTAMSGEEKAGLLLLSLNPKVTEAVLGQLSADVKARLQSHMQRLGKSPKRQEFINEVLQEAELLLQQPALQIADTSTTDTPTGTSSGSRPLRLVGAEQLGDGAPTNGAKQSQPQQKAEEPAQPLGSQAVDTGDAAVAGAELNVLSALNRLNGDRIVLALEGENFRTIALVLNCLAMEKAGAVFKHLEPSVRREVSVQMGTCAMPGTAVLQRTLRAILTKEQTLPAAAVESKSEARFKKMAELLRQLERPDRSDALTALQERDVGAANKVRELLYVFEDILCLDGRSVQKVLGEIDSKTLAVALKGTTEEIKQKVMDNMSKRAREGLLEELAFLGTMPSSQIQQAQRGLADVIQKLDQSGEIVMLR